MTLLRWIDERPGMLGQAVGLDPARNFHAKCVLAIWNKTPPNNDVFPGYPTVEDLTNPGWTTRDAQMLADFVQWWNRSGNTPQPQDPSYSSGIQQSSLTPVAYEVLDIWASTAGGLPTCIENCLAEAVGSISVAAATASQVSVCLQKCGTSQQPAPSPSPAPAPTPSPTPSPAPTPGPTTVPMTCRPGYVMDAQGNCQPLPSPPPPTSAAAVSSNATTVLAVLAGIAVVGLIINAAIKTS